MNWPTWGDQASQIFAYLLSNPIKQSIQGDFGCAGGGSVTGPADFVLAVRGWGSKELFNELALGQRLGHGAISTQCERREHRNVAGRCLEFGREVAQNVVQFLARRAARRRLLNLVQFASPLGALFAHGLQQFQSIGREGVIFAVIQAFAHP